MSLTGVDFTKYGGKFSLSDPIIQLKFIIMVLVLLIIILLTLIFIREVQSIYYLKNIRGKSYYLDSNNFEGNERINENIFTENLKSSLKKINSSDITDVSIALQYLKYQPPNFMSIYKMLDLLARNDLPDKIKDKTIDSLIYLLKSLKTNKYATIFAGHVKNRGNIIRNNRKVNIVSKKEVVIVILSLISSIITIYSFIVTVKVK